MSLHACATLAVVSTFLAMETLVLFLPGLVLHANRLPLGLLRLGGPHRRPMPDVGYRLGGYESRLIDSVQRLSSCDTDPPPEHGGDCSTPPLSQAALYVLHMQPKRADTPEED